MRLSLILILFVTVLVACHRQTKNQDALDALNKSAENSSTNKSILDLKTIAHLKDSGLLVNNVKEGPWIEYSVDSSLVGQSAEVVVGDSTMKVDYGITLNKYIGTYLHGKREGKWSSYNSTNKEFIVWDKRGVTEYSAGLKNGTDIYYQVYDEKEQIPLYERHFVNDVENGIGKIYNVNSPYHLQKLYTAKNGIQLLLKEFYDDDKPHYIFNDTILNGAHLKYVKSYDEEGNLSQTGFFVNDSIQQGNWTEYYKTGKIKSLTTYQNGLIEGVYKYFHDNGQPWTEQTYVHGKAMEIISNLDRSGKPLDKGTLKNGNGTILLYDENGKQTSIRVYRNGDLLNERTYQ